MMNLLAALRVIAGRLPLLVFGSVLGVVLYLALEAPALEKIHDCEREAHEAIKPFAVMRDAIARGATRDVRGHVDIFRDAYERCR